MVCHTTEQHGVSVLATATAIEPATAAAATTTTTAAAAAAATAATAATTTGAPAASALLLEPKRRRMQQQRARLRRGGGSRAPRRRARAVPGRPRQHRAANRLNCWRMRVAQLKAEPRNLSQHRGTAPARGGGGGSDTCGGYRAVSHERAHAQR
jgi:hypothetical protein